LVLSVSACVGVPTDLVTWADLNEEQGLSACWGASLPELSPSWKISLAVGADNGCRGGPTCKGLVDPYMAVGMHLPLC
jgi:hypothetical protein